MTGRTTLALDLGKDMGWAYGVDGVILYSGTACHVTKNAHSAHQFLKFEEWLFQFKDVNSILFERVSGFKGFQAAMNYGAYKAILQRFCLIHGIQTQNMRPNDIKKMFTGNGNAPKELMCETAHKLGWRGGMLGTRIDHDECDAIALLYCVYKALGITPRIGAAPIKDE